MLGYQVLSKIQLIKYQRTQTRAFPISDEGRVSTISLYMSSHRQSLQGMMRSNPSCLTIFACCTPILKTHKKRSEATKPENSETGLIKAPKPKTLRPARPSKPVCILRRKPKPYLRDEKTYFCKELNIEAIIRILKEVGLGLFGCTQTLNPKPQMLCRTACYRSPRMGLAPRDHRPSASMH